MSRIARTPVLAGLLIAFAALACSGGGAARGPDPTPTPPPCSDDTTCLGLDQECVAGLCRPRVAPACRINSDCPREYEICVAGACTVECRLARDCADGMDCVNSRCRRLGDRCTADGDCPGGQSCIGGTCTLLVSEPAAPTAGRYRDPCSRSSACETNMCVGDPRTGVGFCSRACAGQGDCPAPDVCLQLQEGIRACGPDVGGGDVGAPCPGGDPTPCQAGLCVTPPGGTPLCTAPCIADAGCPPGFQCLPAQTPQGIATLCQPGTRAGAGFGATCGATSPCASGLCIDNGTCTYCSATCVGGAGCPPGFRCQAVPDGSGGLLPVCVTDQCGGGQATGGYRQPCRTGDDCESGVCATDLRTGLGFCSRACAADNECPAPDRCLRAQQGRVCGPRTAGGTGTDGTSTDVGTPCRGGDACQSGLCLEDDASGYCTARCTLAVGCGTAGFACAALGTGAERDYYCQQAGPTRFGEACTAPEQCETAVCVGSPEGGAWCSRDCDDRNPCLAGFACTALGDGAQVCLPQ